MRPFEAGDVGHHEQPSRAQVESTGNADAADQHPTAGQAGAAGQRFAAARQLLYDMLAAASVRRFDQFRDDVSVHVGQRRMDFGPADIGAEHQRAVGADLVGGSAAADCALRAHSQLHPAAVLEVAEHLRHGLLGQAGQPRKLGARYGAPVEQDAHHSAERDLPCSCERRKIGHEKSNFN